MGAKEIIEGFAAMFRIATNNYPDSPHKKRAEHYNALAREQDTIIQELSNVVDDLDRSKEYRAKARKLMAETIQECLRLRKLRDEAQQNLNKEYAESELW